MSETPKQTQKAFHIIILALLLAAAGVAAALTTTTPKQRTTNEHLLTGINKGLTKALRDTPSLPTARQCKTALDKAMRDARELRARLRKQASPTAPANKHKSTSKTSTALKISERLADRLAQAQACTPNHAHNLGYISATKDISKNTPTAKENRNILHHWWGILHIVACATTLALALLLSLIASLYHIFQHPRSDNTTHATSVDTTTNQQETKEDTQEEQKSTSTQETIKHNNTQTTEKPST